MKWILPVILFAGAGACAENSTENTRSSELERAVEAPDPAASKAANDYERAAKLAHASAATPTPVGPVAQEVNWEEARGFKTLDPALLPADQREKLAAITVPVLAFDDAALLQTALLTHNVNWYVVAVDGDGLNMMVRGTRNAFEVPGMEIPEAAREAAKNYTLSRTHAIVSVSWRAFDVSYTLDVECARPLEDPRCTEDAFALQTVEALGIIGGAR